MMGSRDDHEVREFVIAGAQQRLPSMARLGMSADQIEASFESLNETEADLVWLLARHEVARAGRPIAPARAA
jgi:hypothetical protein